MTIAIGCDLGGSHLSVAVIQDKALLAARDVPVDSRLGLKVLLPLIETAIRELLASCALQASDCLGLALTLPSLVDFKEARVVSTNNKYPDATSVDLHGWCNRQFGLPLAVENDARAALCGEHFCGAGEGYADVLLLTLGTGIGSALIIDGAPYRARHVQGGNLGGHIPVALQGRKCTCGAIGCMEAEASSWSLPAIVAEWPGVENSSLSGLPSIDFKELFRHARAGDIIACQVVDRCIHVWSVGTVGLIHAYGPERVIFAGGIMSSADQILPRIQNYVTRHAWSPSGPVSIVPAKLGNHAALYGAVPILRAFLQGESRGHDLR
jgi:glucokinase